MTERRSDTVYLEDCLIVPKGAQVLYAGLEAKAEVHRCLIYWPGVWGFWTRSRLRWLRPFVRRYGAVRVAWTWVK